MNSGELSETVGRKAQFYMAVSGAAAIVLATLSLAACSAGSRSGVISIPLQPVVGTSGGPLVAITLIADEREFAADFVVGGRASLPAEVFDDESVRARAVARYPVASETVRQGGQRSEPPRNAGDVVMLSGERNVRQLVAAAVTNGLRRRGYRVHGIDDGAATEAIPLEVRVQTFWGWFHDGRASRSMSFESTIVLTAPITGLERGVRVDASATLSTGSKFPSPRNWRNTVTAGVRRLVEQITVSLPAPKT